MQFFKRNIWTIMCLALFCVFGVSSDVLAGGTSVDGADTLLGTATTKARNVFMNVKSIIFIVGGFGLVALAFFAIFGKVKWSWFAGLAVGLAILAAAGAIIEYATGEDSGTIALGDTFGRY